MWIFNQTLLTFSICYDVCCVFCCSIYLFYILDIFVMVNSMCQHGWDKVCPDIRSNILDVTCEGVLDEIKM